MKKINLLLVLLILFAALFCATGVASAYSVQYVGNTVVDLTWSKYGSEDLSCYKLYRSGSLIQTIFNRNTTFYRDTGPSKGVTYNYKYEVYNKTGVLKVSITRSATTGNVHGTITKDLTWIAATSPYTLTGGVSVAADVTLTIANGVTVNSGSHGISVSGTLSPLDSVTFNGKGIYLSHVDGFSIKNCVFDGTTASVDDSKGIYLYRCNNSIIRNNVIKNHRYGIYLTSSSRQQHDH